MTNQGERSVGLARRASVDQSRTSASEPLIERGFLVFLGVALALIVACLPFALRLDAQTDRQGPMYSDLTLMAWLQYVSLRDEGTVVRGRFGPGKPATVAGRSFVVARGVVVDVRANGAGFCVRASNRFADGTEWHCHDLDSPPERVRLSKLRGILQEAG